MTITTPSTIPLYGDSLIDSDNPYAIGSVTDNCTWSKASTEPCSGLAPTAHGNLSHWAEGEGGPTLMDRLAEEASFRWAMTIVMWVYPAVVVIGIVGNLLSLWVLLRRGMRRTSACRYLACLAVVDSLVLLTSATKTWVRVVWGFELLHVSVVSCKLLIFLTHWSLTTAAWLIVAVTVERFTAIWWPLKAMQVCSIRKTRQVIVSVVVLMTCANSPLLYTAQLVPVSSRGSTSSSGVQCAVYADQSTLCQALQWVHLTLYSFLPAGLLLTLNSLILYMLYQHRLVISGGQDSRSSRSSSANNYKVSINNACAGTDQDLLPPPALPPIQLPRHKSHSRPLLQPQTSAGSRRSSQAPQHFHRRLAPMLLGVSFCWLFLTTPQTAYNLTAPRPADMSQMASQFLLKTVWFLMMYVNHAINFFLYCMTGQRFRQELKRGLACSTMSERHRQVKEALLKCGVFHGNQRSSGQDDVNIS